MTWPFSPEHDQLRQVVRRFIEERVRPHVADWDDAGSFPNSLYGEFANQGLLGLMAPEEYGGSGPDLLAQGVLMEELGRCGSGGVYAGIGAHLNLAIPTIDRLGTPAQKARVLVGAIAGQLIGALGISEPEAGSDVAAVRTTAEHVDGGFVLNGTKTFITNGARADFAIVLARTHQGERPHDGLSLFIVPSDTPGYKVTRTLRKLGWLASDTAELIFEDCRLPEDALLGELGRGFQHVMRNFELERIGLALIAVGEAEAILEETKRYAIQRQAFGKPIGDLQVIRHMLADSATELEAARALAYRALGLMAAGGERLPEVSMAKLYATEAGHRIANTCLQVHGGYGYMREFAVERVFRDSRLGPIGGGTSQIMREIIGRELLQRAGAS